MAKGPLQEKIESANTQIAAAEAELDAALRELRVQPRAEKMTINKVVDDAFVRLRAARQSLIELAELLEAHDAGKGDKG